MFTLGWTMVTLPFSIFIHCCLQCSHWMYSSALYFHYYKHYTKNNLNIEMTYVNNTVHNVFITCIVMSTLVVYNVHIPCFAVNTEHSNCVNITWSFMISLQTYNVNIRLRLMITLKVKNVNIRWCFMITLRTDMFSVVWKAT